MRKTFLFLALGLLMAISANAAKELYSKLIIDSGTLLFVYDENRSTTATEQHPTLYEPNNNPGDRFAGYNTQVLKIVIDESVQDWTPSNLINFFGGSSSTNSLSNASSITGLQYLKTSSVSTMTSMFYGLSNITTLDLSTFNTTNVTVMVRMFYNCQKLESIKLGANFNTWKVQRMEYMFSGCNSLKSINLSQFKTSNVQYMQCMFQNCAALKELDFTNLDMSKVKDVSYMLAGCMSLTTIYCASDWTKLTALTDDKSVSMFTSCTKLKGGKGTAYNSSVVNRAYARPDGGTEAPGYFTALKKVYTEFVESTSTLTYYCDDKYATREGIVEIYNPNSTLDRFNGYSAKVLTIDIDESMADTSLVNMVRFFSSGNSFLLQNATSIKHLENLNTTNTADVDWMFYGLSALTSLDISYFDTDNMTNMGHMFVYCTALERLRLGDNFNTAKVTSFREMFNGCQALKAIDCSHMNVNKVGDMCRLFRNNQALVTIWCNEDWSVKENINDWGDAFYGCTALKGGKGTAYNASYVMKQYARPDGGPESETPGYFTPTSVLQDLKDEVNASLDALKKGESAEVDEIIADAKSDVNSYVWDLTMTYQENADDFDAVFDYDWLMTVKTAITNQYALEQSIEKLKAAIDDLTALRMFADNYLENAELVASINTDINNASAVYNNPSATLAEVNTALKNATDAIENYKGLMMPMAKEQLKADLNALLKEGDPQACKDIVDAAVAQVDEIIVWDNTKNVTDNLVALTTAGETLYNTTKAAVEKARKETSIDAIVGSSVKDAKVIRDGHLYIQRGNELFNAQGARVK